MMKLFVFLDQTDVDITDNSGVMGSDQSNEYNVSTVCTVSCLTVFRCLSITQTITCVNK